LAGNARVLKKGIIAGDTAVVSDANAMRMDAHEASAGPGAVACWQFNGGHDRGFFEVNGLSSI